MPLNAPTVEELARVARTCGFNLSAQDLESFRRLIEPAIVSFRRLDEMTEPSLPVKYPRDAGHRPASEHNPLGAWCWRCEIQGATQGPLAGKTFAIKDNVCVAGIPMMNGTSLLEGFVPDVDATIVTRILDAGGTILGKSVCESLCLSGGSHTSDTGPVRNPHDPSRSTGGSSSGSGALVAAREVDMAVGGDQGGSIRMPASWCGIYGLKPTWGLVPYTGAFPIELTLDHLGPMARSAADCALMLEVIAGPDGLDPRQRPDLRGEAYTRALTGDVKGLRMALVREGFGLPGVSEQDVDDCVRAAAYSMEKLGAQVSTISIPWHRNGLHLWSAIGTQGVAALVTSANALGSGWKGHYTTAMLDAFAGALPGHADNLSETAKMFAMLGQYVHERSHGRYYAKAQNLARELTAAYDAALREHDLLVMPTTPITARPLPRTGCSREEYIASAGNMGSNCGQFDISGHPAINVPCGSSQGLPIGMMLVGRIGEDATVLRAADAWQRNFAS
jgi:amidase